MKLQFPSTTSACGAWTILENLLLRFTRNGFLEFDDLLVYSEAVLLIILVDVLDGSYGSL